MSDDDDESYCDCADDLERHLRIKKAADGQFPEDGDLATLFGTELDPSNKKDVKRCGSSCGPNVEEPSRCGKGGYRAVDNDTEESEHHAGQGSRGMDQATSEGGFSDVQKSYGAGKGGYGARQGGYGAGRGTYKAGQEGYGAGQGAYGAGQGAYGAGQGAYGAGQGAYGAGPGAYGAGQKAHGAGPGAYGAGQGGYGAGQRDHVAGQGYGPDQEGYGGGPGSGPGRGPKGYNTVNGIHRASQVGLGNDAKEGAAGIAGDSALGRVVGGAQSKTPFDVWMPIIGGGLVSLALIVFFYRYFEVGTSVKSKVKTFTTEVMNLLCDPKTSSVVSRIGAGFGGAGAGRGAGSGADSAGGAGAGGGKACSEIFSNDARTPRNKEPACGSKIRIHNSRRKFPLPPTPYTFPVIPGLHDCTDDEENEEGVHVAPGPFEQ